MATEPVPVTPAVLRWARESAGVTPEEAAKRAAVTLERLADWEEGRAEPTLAKLRTLGTLYQRPLSVFLLPEPPPFDVGASSTDDVEGASAVETDDLELRLSGLTSPDGEIAFADLTAIAGPLQELATRIGRFAVDQEGPGRSHAAVENATRLRLSGLSEGSTRLRIGYGQTDVFPIDDGLEERTYRLFWEVVSGLASGDKPSWTTAGIDESAVRVLDGLGRAGEVSFARGADRSVTFRPAEVDRTPWTRSSERVTDAEVTMVGRLEAVDLASGNFRLRDDVGNKIPLHHVVDPHVAAHLVDQRVSATGRKIRGPQGEFKGVDSPALTIFAVPTEWLPGAPLDWAAIRARPGPDPDGGVDMTDEEFAELLAAMKG